MTFPNHVTVRGETFPPLRPPVSHVATRGDVTLIAERAAAHTTAPTLAHTERRLSAQAVNQPFGNFSDLFKFTLRPRVPLAFRVALTCEGGGFSLSPPPSHFFEKINHLAHSVFSRVVSFTSVAGNERNPGAFACAQKPFAAVQE